MKIIASLAISAAMIAAPVLAQDAAPTQPAAPVTPAPDRDSTGVYQVFRTTDNQLNCAQLISEMNQLNAAIKQQAENQQKNATRNRTGRQAAGNALGGALGGLARSGIARNVPGLGYSGALAAAGATDAAAAAVGSAVASGGSGQTAAATTSDEQQRLNRVSQIFGSKGC